MTIENVPENEDNVKKTNIIPVLREMMHRKGWQLRYRIFFWLSYVLTVTHQHDTLPGQPTGEPTKVMLVSFITIEVLPWGWKGFPERQQWCVRILTHWPAHVTSWQRAVLSRMSTCVLFCFCLKWHLHVENTDWGWHQYSWVSIEFPHLAALSLWGWPCRNSKVMFSSGG